MRVLSKSRFKLGLECPNKLFFTRKPEYANLKAEDTFLQSLAEGGFQVEELARLHYPGGVLIDEKVGYEELSSKTKELMEKENVVIYEAAFMYDGLFVRTDILEKHGGVLKIIEVKAKSFNPEDPHTFVGKMGGLVGSWKPYLFDLTFQKYVVQQAYPEYKVEAGFMLADKTKETTIDGLNQLFRVSKNARNRTGIVKKITDIADAGESVLSECKMDEITDEIIADIYPYSEGLNFTTAVNRFNEWYQKDIYPGWPLSFSACKACEFKNSEEKPELKSGYEFCFRKQANLTPDELTEPNIFELWNFRKGSGLFEEGRFFLEELSEDDVGLKPEADQFSNSERQWIQVEKAINNDFTLTVEKESLKEELRSWIFPLHMIDFETSAVALPFTKGMRPYEQTAFQFSHHKIYKDGSVHHATEYINTEAGVFPNFDFLRSLKQALEGDSGSIFRYSHHENTILNAIYEQLRLSDEDDKEDLMAFIKEISHSKNDSVEKWEGQRDMIDLCEVVKKYYYNPHTKGSNSIKAVLPAVLEVSEKLKAKYTKPLSELNLTSKNFDDQHVWLQSKNGKVLSPYTSLPEVFEGDEQYFSEHGLSELESISDGGAALMAYAKLQYQDMDIGERNRIKQASLKYCELDTLAMVMIYEHFQEII